MYPLLRRLLFLLPAERAHYVSMNGLRLLCALPPLRRLLRCAFTPRGAAPVAAFGLQFRNSVGLGAGFDKNARYLRELDTLGFGFVEIGTVTPRPQAGNPKPRLFRLPQDGALINRMGFNNEGVDAAARRLKAWRRTVKGQASPLLIGGNIGKNKDTPNEEAAEDYLICLRALAPLVDFFVVNVSSPNTPGLRALQEGPALRALLEAVVAANRASAHPRPVLLKVAPDLSPEALTEIAGLALDTRLDGIVATNTTVSRSGLKTDREAVEAAGAGGLSGAPVLEASTACLEVLHRTLNGRLPLIGSGGIFTGEDAARKKRAGATLVEVWTGFIYTGPGIVKSIAHSPSYQTS